MSIRRGMLILSESAAVDESKDRPLFLFAHSLAFFAKSVSSSSLFSIVCVFFAQNHPGVPSCKLISFISNSLRTLCTNRMLRNSRNAFVFMRLRTLACPPQAGKNNGGCMGISIQNAEAKSTGLKTGHYKYESGGGGEALGGTSFGFGGFLFAVA